MDKETPNFDALADNERETLYELRIHGDQPASEVFYTQILACGLVRRVGDTIQLTPRGVAYVNAHWFIPGA